MDRFDSDFMPKDRGQFYRGGVNNMGLGSGLAKKDKGARAGRDVDPMDKMVASIRLLREQFVRVQQIIVNAFLEGLQESNKSMEMPSEP